MKIQVAYCSACDHDVRIALPDEPLATDGHANVPDPEIVCLEIGSSCTGALCPIGAQPPRVMAARLIRSGLKPVFQPLIASQCDRCQTVTSFAVIAMVKLTGMAWVRRPLEAALSRAHVPTN